MLVALFTVVRLESYDVVSMHSLLLFLWVFSAIQASVYMDISGLSSQPNLSVAPLTKLIHNDPLRSYTRTLPSVLSAYRYFFPLAHSDSALSAMQNPPSFSGLGDWISPPAPSSFSSMSYHILFVQSFLFLCNLNHRPPRCPLDLLKYMSVREQSPGCRWRLNISGSRP